MSFIGQNIKINRERRNMSQEELAKRVRIGSALIEKYESGEKTPDTKTVLKISTVLDIPASELLDTPTQLTISQEVDQLVDKIGNESTLFLLRTVNNMSIEDINHLLAQLHISQK
jgi:transcriptional regulator with XRE-family HTH domain